MESITKHNAGQVIGDGKLPNKYSVSISNDFYISKEGGYLEGYEEESFKSKGFTAEVYDTYSEAKEQAGYYSIGEQVKDFTVNRITIEDRISGELYQNINVFYPNECKTEEMLIEDTSFTESRLGEDFE